MTTGIFELCSGALVTEVVNAFQARAQSIYMAPSLTRTVEGTCLYGPNDTCTASSTYVISGHSNFSGTFTYNWVVEGADIYSGQGTDTLVVQTTSDRNIDFSVVCTVEMSSTIGTSTHELAYNDTHTRTLEDLDIYYTGEVV